LGEVVKIVHITSAHPWNDIRIFHKMCRSLAASGDDVTLIAPRDDGVQEEVVNGVRVLGVCKRDGRFSRMTSTVRDVLAVAEKQDADVFHFHDPEILLQAPRFARRTGKSVVYDAHEDVRNQVMSKPWLPAPSRAIVSRAVGMVEDYASRSISGAVAATPHIADRFAELPKSVVIQNFPMLAEFRDLKAPESPSLESFVYVGGMSAIRGAKEMIDALALTRHAVHLDIAGSWSSQSERARCMGSAGWPRVVEHGQLKRKETCELLANAGCGFVLFHPVPNHIDAQPNKMFEYMAAGLPLICSNFPLWRMIVDEARCGLLVNPLDPAAIAEAMDWIIDHPAEAHAMGERGRIAVQSRYNWESEFPKLRLFYESLM
jgi:glycosyltransferase involved in cell wall biosynthesis